MKTLFIYEVIIGLLSLGVLEREGPMNKVIGLYCKYIFPCKGNVYNFTTPWEAIFSPAWSDFDSRGKKRVQTIWERSDKLLPGYENSKPGFVDLKPYCCYCFCAHHGNVK